MKSVKVDTINLQGNIRTLEKEIVSFEENELTLFSKVMSLKNIWNDGYTTSFYEKMEEEKRSFDLLIQDLKQFKDIYSYIYSSTSKYGKKIQADFNNTSSITNRYSSCKQMFNTIGALYNNLDLSHCSEVASRIQSQKSKLSNTQKYLDNYMNKFNQVMTSLKNMEQEVGNKTFRINVKNINDINFQSLPTYDPNTRMIGMTSTEDIETALNNISVSIQEEEDIITRINNSFVTIRNYYISNINSKRLSNKQLDFNCQFKLLKNNHENMVLYVNKLKETYLALEKRTEANISKDIKRVQ